MIDSRALLNVGQRVRILVLTILMLGLAAGLSIVAYYLWFARHLPEPRYNDAILLGFSLIQLMATALVIALVGFYGESEATTHDLMARTRRFLATSVVESLSRVTADPMAKAEATSVTCDGLIDIFGAGYKLESGRYTLRMWVGLNVRRLIVVYWIDAGGEADASTMAGRVAELFRFTFQGAGKVGWATNYETAVVGERPIVSIWSTVEAGENLLTHPAERLFWVQDVAMMTESAWRTAIRNGLTFSQHSPRPL